MVSKLLDENTANIEKAKSLTAGLSAAQLNWQPQPGKWSIAQNLAHLNFGYQGFDTIASSIAAARAKGIIGNGPFRYGWLSSWFVKSQEPPPKRKLRKFKSAKAYAPSPDVDGAKAVADYLRMNARLGELIQQADGVDLARAKTPFLDLKWVKIKLPLCARLAHMTTHDRRHLWHAEQVRNDPNFPIV
jgi:DinB superfamily